MVAHGASNEVLALGLCLLPPVLARQFDSSLHGFGTTFQLCVGQQKKRNKLYKFLERSPERKSTLSKAPLESWIRRAANFSATGWVKTPE